MAKRRNRVGLWLVGACGGVGSTVALGLAALRRGLVPPTGLVTELPELTPADLSPPGGLVIGGHEIRSISFCETVDRLHRQSSIFPKDVLEACRTDLKRMQQNVKPGTLLGASGPVTALAEAGFAPTDRTTAVALKRLTTDLISFRERHKADHVVVVNVASSEPASETAETASSYARLGHALAKSGKPVLPNSSLYALAAVETGCAYVNFTPSTGIDLPALRERADRLGVPYMGRDGKTGETLVKSVLAPMFAMRNLRVRSWFGQNLLGNQDGAVLRDPATRRAKLAAKDRLTRRVLGDGTDTMVSIDYCPSLDDWKIAWDFIHFEGFLQARMSLQFIWQGCDSILAAPLVIDLARLMAHEMERGASGPARHLACFFKDPMDEDRHDLFSQWQRLVEHLRITTRSPKQYENSTPSSRRQARGTSPRRRKERR